MDDTAKSIKFTSSRFGEIEVPESDIIHAPEGIIGFGNALRYVLLDPSGRTSVFLWLQSVDEPNLAFIITDPMLFVPDYQIELDEPDLQRIGLEGKSPPSLFAIVTVPRDNPDGITANLLAPILFFENENLLYQIVLEKKSWPLKFQLVSPEPEKEAE